MSTERREYEPMVERSGVPLARRGYFWLSSRPLHILVFLVPVVVAAELGTIGLGGESIANQLAAHRMLVRFFEIFGVLGLHLPAIAIVITLLIQHVLSSDRTRIEPIVPAAMVVESAFLTGPLLILVLILQPGFSPAAAGIEGTTAGGSGLLLAMGAGLYEEFLFRLVIITAVHFVAADLVRMPSRGASVVAVLVSAVLFAIHHDITSAAGGVNWRLAVFYFFAGVYFGVLFLARGLGIAVGVHALYDLLVLVVIPAFEAADSGG
ncbi:MAG: CPBP family glutamic-type intramembrane protease [Planctomycetota bacterium]